MDRDTFVFLLTQRGHPRIDIKKLPQEELLGRVGCVTDEEQTLLERRREHHDALARSSAQQLREECRSRAIPSSGKTKVDMMDMLFTCSNKKHIVQLDPDQEHIVTSPLVPEQLVSAGPGSGKTTTVVHLLCTHQNKKCLVLAFNRAARDNLKDRLKQLGVRILRKSDVFSSSQGIFVMDFDEFAYQAVKRVDPTYIPEDYTLTKEKAVRSLSQFVFEIDLFVVDEAQDLSHLLGQITDRVRDRSASFYVFGDPRQELYPGCTWFSHKWTDADASIKTYLRYNHRSSKAIVDFLNRYSRANFPTLHFDQIPTRDEQGQVLFFDSPSITTETGIDQCPQYSELCALSPISIKKYNLDVRTREIRQVVYSHYGLAPRLMDGEEKDFDLRKECVIATSKKFKGLEKDSVIVFGVDVDYCNLNIPWEALVKGLFVCISRARDTLILVYEGTAMANALSPLTPLLPGDLPKVQAKPIFLSQKIYLTVDELSEQELGVPEVLAQGECQKVEVESQFDSDFIAIFLKKRLAKQLGCLRHGELKNVDNRQDYRHYSQMFGNSSKYKFLGHQRDFFFYSDALRPMIEEKRTAIENQTISCYELAQLDYSNTIQKLWTVSERLKDYDGMAIEIPLQPGVVFEELHTRDIYNSRGESVVTLLLGKTDFFREGYCAQIKFTDEIQARTRKEAGLFAWMNHLPYVTVYNLRQGVYEEIAPLQDPSLHIHAYSAMRLAQTVHLRTRNPIVCPADGDCVAIDFETRGFTNRITEIGAVRYNPFTRKVLAVFHEIAPGVEVGSSSETWSRLTNLRIAEEEEFERHQTRLLQRVTEWCGESLVVHWAGSEKSIFPKTLDVHQLYTTWSKLQNVELRHGNDLSAAVDRLFCGQLPFTAHRALDDAIATMAVHIALGNYSGTL